jgi:MoxR-like ATPase
VSNAPWNQAPTAPITAQVATPLVQNPASTSHSQVPTATPVAGFKMPGGNRLSSMSKTTRSVAAAAVDHQKEEEKKRMLARIPLLKRSGGLPAAPPVGTENRLATVPDRSAFASYIGRSFSGIDYKSLFDLARHLRHNILIEGPSGSGKTSATMAYAAERDLPFYSVSSSVGVEASQLFGKFIPDGKGAFQWQDGPVTDIIRYGGVLLINEINFFPERISTVLFPVLDFRRTIQLVDHRGETIVGHPNLLIVADMNPGYEGTRPLNKAFRNRFPIQLTWDYDKAVEKSLVGNEALVTFIHALRNGNDTKSIMTPIGTNMIQEFDTLVRSTGNLDFVINNFLSHFQAGERSFITTTLNAHRGNISAEYQKQGVQL